MSTTDSRISHILISQIKNIGDVVLALPVAGLLRAQYPKSIISFLVTRYTKPIVEGCPDIDQVYYWDESVSDDEIIQQWKKARFSAIVHLCNNTRIAKLAKKIGIPCRIGTAQRLSNWIYCNRWVNQTRRHSDYHETELNIHLLKPLGIKRTPNFSDITGFLHFQPKGKLPAHLEALLHKKPFNVILHPGSHGHGREWPEASFKALIKKLPEADYQIFLTGGQQEKERFKTLLACFPQAINLMGELTLEELVVFISRVDGVVASGTGPLHISAALGVRTLGLFPPRWGISPKRWTPVGKEASVLVYDRPFYEICISCKNSVGCACMAQIQVKQVLNVINKWYKEIKK